MSQAVCDGHSSVVAEPMLHAAHCYLQERRPIRALQGRSLHLQGACRDTDAGLAASAAEWKAII